MKTNNKMINVNAAMDDIITISELFNGYKYIDPIPQTAEKILFFKRKSCCERTHFKKEFQ
jgi:hypothetical protein